ncbi:hypothetical protein ABT097_01810 [Streptomyces sp. NPDC002225]|uniref:hypothetical protein n=1 Tax=Streptomyces sp. NPDC002225 TaxID=3154413 RepID=UPI0033232825
MTGENTARAIDADRLPEDVLALVDALGPGEELVITRGGAPFARVTPVTRTVLVGTLVAPPKTSDTSGASGTPGTPEEEPRPPDGSVTVVATAMELSDTARTALSDRLGPDYIVLDMRSAPRSADVLLVPPVSPQLIGSLRSSFPDARLVVTEIEDPELGVDYQGPVRRLLDAGAELYLPPATLPRLADQLAHALTHPPGPALESPAAREIEPAEDP